ncbi:MAG: energy transducer TonB, partial [Myxococcota bacterium]|nr:energy transducer TonB [Myxococcota bacterium]
PRTRTTAPPLRDEGEPGEPRIELFSDDALGPAVGWELRSAPRAGSLEESSEEDLDRWMDDRLREQQIGAGAVDGWYYAMRDSMRSSFRPDRGAMEAERRAGMNPLEIAADELGRYAQPPQRPIDPGGHAPQTIFSRSREDEMAQDRFDERNPLHAPITWYRVELRVVHDRHGRVATVHVTRSSGMRSMDRAAIDAIRGGTVRLPLPPPSVVGARDTITTEWAFQVGDVATRIDTLAAVEDPDGEGMQVGALGRGVVRTSIQLLRVIDAAHPTFDERRDARRARRPPR